jgi:hypothetical protein
MRNVVLGVLCTLILVAGFDLTKRAFAASQGDNLESLAAGDVEQYGKTGGYKRLGSSSSPCKADGTTASDSEIHEGTWIVEVVGENVALCDARDADCAGAPASLVPGTQRKIRVLGESAGTWHCSSPNGMGWAVFRKVKR